MLLTSFLGSGKIIMGIFLSPCKKWILLQSVSFLIFIVIAISAKIKGNFKCTEPRKLEECNKWKRWDGKEYKFISSNQNWTESRQLCESDGAHLVIIENKEENIFIHKVIQDCSSLERTWIGLHRLENDAWKWSNGKALTYINWNIFKVQPNEGKGEDCVNIRRDNGTWHDQKCSMTSWNAVCERNNTLQ